MLTIEQQTIVYPWKATTTVDGERPCQCDQNNLELGLRFGICWCVVQARTIQTIYRQQLEFLYLPM